ncbi:MAG TPA: serine hydrolase domain-containing protein [Acidobacteriaceae bacterium]|jgi:CubicO group peptidase (beta-lactamase class C family)|nr:serine hydrolase domain-containing protein [Acidobacteriaceae bacterium]
MRLYFSVRKISHATFTALLFAVVSIAATAQVDKTHAPTPAEAPSATSTPPSATTPQLDSADVTAFMDGIIPIQLDRSDVAGAAVFVIQNGNVLLLKGYGYANEKKHTPVDVNVSGFRPGSISKLFTWISIMQLVEQGKINLDTDVNQYLDFKIHESWGKPLTIRDLMTHRPGFEETVRDLIRKAPAKPLSLREYLTQNQPAQIFPPGDIPAYSNYGAGLAGYIVQRISGERYEDYVQRHIFTPLGMTHSTYEQPLPKNWPVHPGAGYGSASRPMLPFEMVAPAPAGALTTTAADMVRFAQALMNGGELDGQRILQPQTLAEMWTPQYAANPALPAMCLGFYQQRRNGQTWIGHGGDLIAYHSEFMIEPEKKLAIFISYNSAGAGETNLRIGRAEFFDQFVDRYFPQAAVSAPAHPVNATPPSQVVGTYWSSRRGVKNRLQMFNVLGQSHATVAKDGKLVIDSMKTMEGTPIHWEPVSHDLWVYSREQRHLAAIRDAQGNIVRLAGDFPAQQSLRVPWYARDKGNLWLLGLSLFVCICVLWAAALRWHHRKLAPVAHVALQKLRRAQIWTSLWWLIVGATVTAFISAISGDATFSPDASADKWLLLLNILVLIALACTLWLVVKMVRSWNALPKGFWLHLRVLIVFLAALFLSWFSIYWKVLGPVHHF